MLQRAAEPAPGDTRVLIHYSQALRAAGRQNEARQALARFRQAGDQAGRRRVPFAGMLDSLNLPPQQQRVRYLANLEKIARDNPADVSLQARWGKELLTEGRPQEARNSRNSGGFANRSASPAGRCRRWARSCSP